MQKQAGDEPPPLPIMNRRRIHTAMCAEKCGIYGVMTDMQDYKNEDIDYNQNTADHRYFRAGSEEPHRVIFSLSLLFRAQNRRFIIHGDSIIARIIRICMTTSR